jgi:hypothetical protein
LFLQGCKQPGVCRVCSRVQPALVRAQWQPMEGRAAACWVLVGLQVQAWLLLVHGQLA